MVGEVQYGQVWCSSRFHIHIDAAHEIAAGGNIADGNFGTIHNHASHARVGEGHVGHNSASNIVEYQIRATRTSNG